MLWGFRSGNAHRAPGEDEPHLANSGRCTTTKFISSHPSCLVKSIHTKHGGCKWGLYGDTAYINPAIFQGTIRQRTVGSSAQFQGKQAAPPLQPLKRWKTQTLGALETTLDNIRNRDHSVHNYYYYFFILIIILFIILYLLLYIYICIYMCF